MKKIFSTYIFAHYEAIENIDKFGSSKQIRWVPTRKIFVLGCGSPLATSAAGRSTDRGDAETPLPKTAFHRYYKLPCCKHLSNLFPESFSDFIKLRSVNFRGFIHNIIFKSPLTIFVRFYYFNYTPKSIKFKTFYLFTKSNDIIFKKVCYFIADRFYNNVYLFVKKCTFSQWEL